VDLFVKLLVAALVAAGAWVVLTPHRTFVIRVRAGAARATQGKVTAAFVEEVGRACGEAGVPDGWVGGVRRGRRVWLTFSPAIPPPLRQRLRNLWLLHG
jgi:hypothetical protein